MNVALILSAAVAFLAAGESRAQQAEEQENCTTNCVSHDRSLVENDESDAWSAIAPALTAGTDVCLGSTSAAAQTPFAGISFGTTWTDENCENIRAAKALYAMGQTKAAMYVMCYGNGGRNVLPLKMGGFDCGPVLGEAEREVAEAGAVQLASSTRQGTEDAAQGSNR